MNGSRASTRSPSDLVLKWCIERPLPASIAVGGGSALALFGWCFHPEAAITDLRFIVGGNVAPALAHSLPRPDVYHALCPEHDPTGKSYASGFYAAVALPGVREDEQVDLYLQADLADGRRVDTDFDRITLSPHRDVAAERKVGGTRIAICMATYNPEYELFARQVESISNQSSPDWRCVISDDRSDPRIFDRMRALVAGDDRFVLDRSPVRLGTYENFERALSLVAPDIEMVALADQDDTWYPEKLEALSTALRPRALLAYSDCRVVRPDGAVLASTFFSRRRNNWRSFRKMLLANTVTGASAMFRRELLDDALPFPPPVDPRVSFHDHWLAALALSIGELAYVDRPLYDYVQHSENEVGHPSRRSADQVQAHRGPRMLRWQVTYQYQLLRTATMARALERRVGERMPADNVAELRRLIAVDRSLKALARMVLHAIPARAATSATEGAERDVLGAVLWRRRMSHAARRRDRLGHPWFTSAIEPASRLAVTASEDEAVGELVAAATPLQLAVSDAQPKRVNLLTASTHAFGAALALAGRLDSAGSRVRIVVTERPLQPSPDRLQRLRAAAGLPESIEVVDASDRFSELAVNPADAFIATGWVTAALAHAASASLGNERFLYVIDDYEAARLPASLAAQAESTYRLAHYALFLGPLLRDHFRFNRLGMFEPGRAGEEEECVTIASATAPMELPPAGRRGHRAPSRLLVDARQGADGRSAMFELTVAALERAAEQGVLAGWEVNGIGADGTAPATTLARDVQLVFLGPTGPERYRELLRGHDAGLALSGTAVPSLMSLEMATAGLPTVTNSSGVRTQPGPDKRSANLIVVETSVEAVASGVRTAVERAQELQAAVVSTSLDSPRDWADAIDAAATQRIQALLAKCSARAAATAS